jgi:hypothetical protein
MKVMCECCGLNPREVRDYRRDEVTGAINKFLVCRNCFNLNDYWFYKLMRAKEGRGKKRVVRQILSGDDWKKWLITDKLS